MASRGQAFLARDTGEEEIKIAKYQQEAAGRSGLIDLVGSVLSIGSMFIPAVAAMRPIAQAAIATGVKGTATAIGHRNYMPDAPKDLKFADRGMLADQFKPSYVGAIKSGLMAGIGASLFPAAEGVDAATKASTTGVSTRAVQNVVPTVGKTTQRGLTQRLYDPLYSDQAIGSYFRGS